MCYAKIFGSVRKIIFTFARQKSNATSCGNHTTIQEVCFTLGVTELWLVQKRAYIVNRHT